MCPAIANGTISIGPFNPLALKLTQTYVPAANRVVPSINGTTWYLYNFNTADTGGGDQGVVAFIIAPRREIALGFQHFSIGTNY